MSLNYNGRVFTKHFIICLAFLGSAAVLMFKGVLLLKMCLRNLVKTAIVDVVKIAEPILLLGDRRHSLRPEGWPSPRLRGQRVPPRGLRRHVGQRADRRQVQDVRGRRDRMYDGRGIVGE